MSPRSYFVTGANSGCGLEAARQLALHFSEPQEQKSAGDGTSTNKDTDANISNSNSDSDSGSTTTIYLLCRSETKAQAAIEDIRNSINTRASGKNTNDDAVENVRLEFMKFDAYGDNETIRRNALPPFEKTKSKTDKNKSPPIIGGILLNAGGFGDGRKSYSPDGTEHTTETETSETKSIRAPEACRVAKMNLIGHVMLVNHLLANWKTDASTRIVAAGSEAPMVHPNLDFRKADFVAHLAGTVPSRDKFLSYDYAWTKGILGLYWAAFARHHPELYVVSVSVGAVADTQILNQGGSSLCLKMLSYVNTLSVFGGSHSAQAGAKRYVDALLREGLFEEGEGKHPPESGTFLASRKGYVRDFGNVTTLPKGKFVADIDLQDKAWDAVQKFV